MAEGGDRRPLRAASVGAGRREEAGSVAGWPPLVVKIGGGLLRATGPDGLRRLGAVLATAARERPIAVVPGGGPFADAVRDADRAYGLGPQAADRMAILAMEQFGHLLLELLPSAAAGASLTAASWPRGRLTVLLPAQRLTEPHPLPASWEVTSDSIAAWIAAEAGGELLLAKPVAGLIAEWPQPGPPLAEIDADALEALQRTGGGAVVDRWFPHALRRFDVDAAIVDGRDDTIAAVLAGSRRPGTSFRRGARDGGAPRTIPA